MNHNKARLLLLAAIAFSITLYLPLITSGIDKLTFGRFIGLIGLQLIWWQIVLGNRQLTRFVTPDLLWVNKLHRFMGTYGFLLIVLHPLMMIASYGITLVWPPSFDSRFDIGVRLGVTALALLSFVWGISALFRKRLPWRVWKRLHLFAYIIFPLLYLHQFLVGSSTGQFWWLEVWIYSIVTVFWVIVILRLLYWAGFLKQRYKVTETELVAKDVTRFQMQPTGKGIKPKPGQFAYMQGWRYGEAHPFTVSHYDSTSGEISFSIKAVGSYSQRLTTLQVGDTVFIDGPYGIFTVEIGTSDRPVVVIAGGIGITPFIRHLEANTIDYLFWGCRTEADFAYKTSIEASRAQTYYMLSEPTKPRSGFDIGMIDGNFIEKKLDNNLSTYDFYLCGPPPMMNSLQKQLMERGVKPANIHQEKFSL